MTLFQLFFRLTIRPPKPLANPKAQRNMTQEHNTNCFFLVRHNTNCLLSFSWEKKLKRSVNKSHYGMEVGRLPQGTNHYLFLNNQCPLDLIDIQLNIQHSVILAIDEGSVRKLLNLTLNFRQSVSRAAKKQYNGGSSRVWQMSKISRKV